MNNRTDFTNAIKSPQLEFCFSHHGVRIISRSLSLRLLAVSLSQRLKGRLPAWEAPPLTLLWYHYNRDVSKRQSIPHLKKILDLLNCDPPEITILTESKGTGREKDGLSPLIL